MIFTLTDEYFLDCLEKITQNIKKHTILHRVCGPFFLPDMFEYKICNASCLTFKHDENEDIECQYTELFIGTINAFGTNVNILVYYASEGIFFKTEYSDDQDNYNVWNAPESSEKYKKFYFDLVTSFINSQDRTTLQIPQS